MANLLSKLINGSTQVSSAKLHASPVSPTRDAAQNPNSLLTPDKISAINFSSPVKLTAPVKFPASPTQIKPISSIKIPTILPKLGEIEEFFKSEADIKNQVLTPANSSLRTFRIETGLPDDQPVIVLSSEFIPLYEGGVKNFQGTSIKYKQDSRIITAKTAISVLTQSLGAKESIEDSKNELKSYIKDEYTFLNGLVSTTNSTIKSLNLFSYSTNIIFYQVDSPEPVSFPDLLKRSMYPQGGIYGYSQTKLWMQNLVELKKNLFSHTHGLLSDYSPRDNKRDADPFLMSDVSTPQRSTKRMWINPYGMDSITPTIIASEGSFHSNIQKILTFEDTQFINLVLANAPARKLAAPGTNTISKATLSPSDNSNDGISVSNNFLNTFLNTPKDICVLANFLTKEWAYSSFLNKTENEDLLRTKYGYTVTKDRDNMSVWDHVVGRIQDSVFDFPVNTIGNNNSLVSLAQHSVRSGQDTYKILTFESNYLQDQTVTPGGYYYIDSSIVTADGVSFDTSRIDSLVTRVSEAQKTIDMIASFSGYDISEPTVSEYLTNSSAIYAKRSQFSVEPVLDSLSVVSKMYRRCALIDPNTGDMSLNVKNMGVGIIGGFSNEEVVAVRFASILCKVAVTPVASYRQTSKFLKANLFMFLMNVVLKQVENYYNDGVISQAKSRISEILSNVNVNISEEDLESATEEKRSFPTSIGTAKDISAGLESATSDDIFNAAEAGLIFSDPRVKIDRNGNVYEYPIEYISNTGGDSTSQQIIGGLGAIGTAMTLGVGAAVYGAITGSESEERERRQRAQTRANAEIQDWLSRRADQMLRARRRSYDIYSLGAATRLFEVDENRGLWRIVIEQMKNVYTSQSLFDSDASIYSNLPKMTYMYVYFEMLLRVIAAQTPENLLGVYSATRRFTEILSEEFQSAQTQFSVYETGFLIDKVTPTQFSSYYDKSLVQTQEISDRDCSNRLRATVEILRSEDKIFTSWPRIIRKYLLDLGSQLNYFRDYLRKNFEPHLNRVNSLYLSDTSLTQNQRINLLNLSFLQEQVRMSAYVMSEFSDRLNESSDYISKLRSIPHFSSYPDGFDDFMPVNETELVSYYMLSPFFRSEEFLRAKGNNKRIISVGIPPRMLRDLRTETRISSENILSITRQGFVRIKVYKNNRLYPDIVYKPISFLFDMNRYPTRSINNWDYEAFLSETTDIFQIPSKHVILGSSGFFANPVTIHRNYQNAFPSDVFQDLLTEEEKTEMYKNHGISFLLEEYLRWFTDCRFDETRYNNFSGLDSELKSVEDQFNKFIDTVRSISVTPQATKTAPAGRKITARLTDFFNRRTFEIPVDIPKTMSSLQNSQQTSPEVPAGVPSIIPVSEKSYSIPMDNTIRSYFLNETFMLNLDIFKRRISYPKKFDRVFNLIIDPDDFYVDESLSSQQTLRSLQQIGVITGGQTSQTPSGPNFPYRHRDTTPEDVTLDEYFVTIEPFDYVQEYMR